MDKPRLIDLGFNNKVLLIDANYEFEFTICKGISNCDTYTKKAHELDQREMNLIKGELIKTGK